MLAIEPLQMGYEVRDMARAFVGFGCIGLLVFLPGQLCAAPEPDREAIAARSEAAAKKAAKPEGRDVICVPDDYLAILSHIAKVSRCKERRKAILAAGDPAGVLKAITG